MGVTGSPLTLIRPDTKTGPGAGPLWWTLPHFGRRALLTVKITKRETIQSAATVADLADAVSNLAPHIQALLK